MALKLRESRPSSSSPCSGRDTSRSPRPTRWAALARARTGSEMVRAMVRPVHTAANRVSRVRNRKVFWGRVSRVSRPVESWNASW